MSDGYTKLFATITDSTIWAAPDATRLVWITMLAMADQHGYVGASVPGLAARARVPLDDCIKAIETFLAPDKWSRTPEFEGRRITPTDGGWILLNHAKYRAARDKDARREQSRLAMAKLRAERKDVSKVNKVSHGEPPFAQAEAEAEAEASKSKPCIAFALPDWVDHPSWQLWMKTRKGKRMIPEQMQAQIEKLAEMRSRGLDYGQALRDAATNGWQGLFDPKPPAKNKIDLHAETLAGLTGKGKLHDAIDVTPTRSLD